MIADYEKYCEHISTIMEHIRAESMREGAPIMCGPKCGACCKNTVLPISWLDAVTLAFHIIGEDIDTPEFRAQLQALKEKHEASPEAATDCPFLDTDENCSVYEARPLVCRAFCVTSKPWICASQPENRKIHPATFRVLYDQQERIRTMRVRHPEKHWAQAPIATAVLEALEWIASDGPVTSSGSVVESAPLISPQESSSTSPSSLPVESEPK